MKIKANVSISRRYGARNGDTISISIEDASSGIQFVDIEMTPEDFGLAVTGLSSMPATGEVRGLDNVGKKHESKFVKIDVVLPSLTTKDNEAAILAAAAPLEVDGWKASAYWALNVQGGKVLVGEFGSNLYRCTVRFQRYVDAPQDVNG